MFRALLASMLLIGLATAQQTSPATSQGSALGAAPAQKTTPIAVSRTQRLSAAKSVFVKNVEGSEIPVNVITNALEGWGRYTLVNSPEKADLLIEITAPQQEPSSVTITGSHTNTITGRPETNSSTTRTMSNVPIRMAVLDPKTRLPLWTGVEQPKHALKQKAREDNLVEAAQALFSKFHQAVEPSAP
jgi:hypothetical protein